jgi:hypothetical protein
MIKAIFEILNLGPTPQVHLHYGATDRQFPFVYDNERCAHCMVVLVEPELPRPLPDYPEILTKAQWDALRVEVGNSRNGTYRIIADFVEIDGDEYIEEQTQKAEEAAERKERKALDKEEAAKAELEQPPVEPTAPAAPEVLPAGVVIAPPPPEGFSAEPEPETAPAPTEPTLKELVADAEEILSGLPGEVAPAADPVPEVPQPPADRPEGTERESAPANDEPVDETKPPFTREGLKAKTVEELYAILQGRKVKGISKLRGKEGKLIARILEEQEGWTE